MKISLTAAAFATFAVAAAVAQSVDGPFGFKAGDDIALYKNCAPADADGSYLCTSAPKPHVEFPQVNVWHMKGVGICMVSAATEPKNTSVQGYEIMRATDAIADQVALAYGKPKKFDFLHAGSIWSQPQEWTRAVNLKERTYVYTWDKLNKNSVREISVKAHTLGAGNVFVTDGMVRVEFRMTNIDKCRDALKKERASSF